MDTPTRRRRYRDEQLAAANPVLTPAPKPPRATVHDGTLEALLKQLGIKEWDILLVGDGSGTTWKTAIGFTSVMVERSNFCRTLWYGGLSRGTNNVAEMMAYLSPLMYLSSTYRERPYGPKIHIVSDSQYIVNGINGNCIQKGNQELWCAIRATKRKGLVLQAHWIPRDRIGLNKLADAVAGDLRRLMLRITSEAKLDEINPTEA